MDNINTPSSSKLKWDASDQHSFDHTPTATLCLGVTKSAVEAALANGGNVALVIEAGKALLGLQSEQLTQIKMRKTKKKKKKIRGVTKIKKGYKAQIKIRGKVIGLGYYDDRKEAGIAYDRAILKHKITRPRSKLNFPKMKHTEKEIRDGNNNGRSRKRKIIRDDADDGSGEKKRRRTTFVSNSATGYRGVTQRGKKFQSRLRLFGKKKFLGTFDTAKEAAVAYDAAILKYNKSKQLLNFEHDPAAG